MSVWIAYALIFIGSVFVFIAAVGILKMSDIFMRMHAATKAGTLGCGLILAGSAVYFQQTQVSIEAFLTILFIYITAPIASHLIARAAYAQHVEISPSTSIDELRSYYESLQLNTAESDKEKGTHEN